VYKLSPYKNKNKIIRAKNKRKKKVKEREKSRVEEGSPLSTTYGLIWTERSI
jgi:hypothetical protein